MPSNCPTRDDVHMSEIREIDEGMNARFKIDTSRNTFDPSTLVGLQLSNDEKSFPLRMNPCQPSENFFKNTVKKTR